MPGSEPTADSLSTGTPEPAISPRPNACLSLICVKCKRIATFAAQDQSTAKLIAHSAGWKLNPMVCQKCPK